MLVAASARARGPRSRSPRRCTAGEITTPTTSQALELLGRVVGDLWAEGALLRPPRARSCFGCRSFQAGSPGLGKAFRHSGAPPTRRSSCSEVVEGGYITVSGCGEPQLVPGGPVTRSPKRAAGWAGSAEGRGQRAARRWSPACRRPGVSRWTRSPWSPAGRLGLDHGLGLRRRGGRRGQARAWAGFGHRLLG